MTTACKYAILACFFSTGVAQSQQFRFGVRGGLTPTAPTRTYSKDESKRYIVGPVIEVRWGRIALDVSLLYQRYGSSHSFHFFDFNSALSGGNQRARANVWQLPVVGKFYFRPESKWQPFIGTGYAFQRAWIKSEGSSSFIVEGQPRTFSYRTTSRSSTIGAVGAIGLQMRQGSRLAITPEFRYIRWGSFENTPVRFNPNQVQATIGITF